MCRLCTENNRVSNQDYSEKMKDFIHQILDKFDVNRIILFGSYARGDYNDSSDLDLIVVGLFQKNFFNRIGDILDLVPSELDVEVLVYTNEEFEKMVDSKNPFIQTVLSEGIDLIEGRSSITI